MHEDWREVGQRGEVMEEEEDERDRETERRGKGWEWEGKGEAQAGLAGFEVDELAGGLLVVVALTANSVVQTAPGYFEWRWVESWTLAAMRSYRLV